MADSLTLIVLVATGWSPAGTEALLRAAHESLGPETHIDLREMSGEPTDTQALLAERRDHADAVVELGWKDRKRRQATLRVHVARGRRWIDRLLTFEPFDVEVERGRTLGYAMASILPDPFPHHMGSGTQPEAAPAPPSPPPPPAPVPAPEAKPEPPARPTRSAPGSSQGSAAAIDVLVLGSIGVAGDAAAIGGGVAAHWFFFSPLSLRLGAGFDGGNVDIVRGAQLLNFVVSAGVAVHPRRATLARPFGFSIRADFLVIDQQLSAPVPLAKAKNDLFLGVDALAEGSWMFVQGTEALVGVGVEDVFPPLEVTVVGLETKTVPAFRVVGEAGVRVSF